MSFEEFKRLIAEISKTPVDYIRGDLSIRNDLGIDSLQLVNLILHLTERFSLDTSQITSMEDIETVEKMYHKIMGVK